VNALFTVVHIRTFSNAYPPIYSLVLLPSRAGSSPALNAL